MVEKKLFYSLGEVFVFPREIEIDVKEWPDNQNISRFARYKSLLTTDFSLLQITLPRHLSDLKFQHRHLFV